MILRFGHFGVTSAAVLASSLLFSQRAAAQSCTTLGEDCGNQTFCVAVQCVTTFGDGGMTESEEPMCWGDSACPAGSVAGDSCGDHGHCQPLGQGSAIEGPNYSQQCGYSQLTCIVPMDGGGAGVDASAPDAGSNPEHMDASIPDQEVDATAAPNGSHRDAGDGPPPPGVESEDSGAPDSGAHTEQSPALTASDSDDGGCAMRPLPRNNTAPYSLLATVLGITLLRRRRTAAL